MSPYGDNTEIAPEPRAIAWFGQFEQQIGSTRVAPSRLGALIPIAGANLTADECFMGMLVNSALRAVQSVLPFIPLRNRLKLQGN